MLGRHVTTTARYPPRPQTDDTPRPRCQRPRPCPQHPLCYPVIRRLLSRVIRRLSLQTEKEANKKLGPFDSQEIKRERERERVAAGRHTRRERVEENPAPWLRRDRRSAPECHRANRGTLRLWILGGVSGTLCRGEGQNGSQNKYCNIDN